MKVSLILAVISKNESGASTLTATYLHHHPVSHPPFTQHLQMPVPDRLSGPYLLRGIIISDCDKKSSFLCL